MLESFLPAISLTAVKAFRQTVRRSRRHHRHTVDVTDLPQVANPALKKRLTYYGRLYRSALCAVFDLLDLHQVGLAQETQIPNRLGKTQQQAALGEIDARHAFVTRLSLFR